jgi:hypothetical protein
VSIQPHVVCRDAATVIEALRKGEPGIIVLPGADESFYLGPDLLHAGEDVVVLDRVIAELTAASG